MDENDMAIGDKIAVFCKCVSVGHEYVVFGCECVAFSPVCVVYRECSIFCRWNEYVASVENMWQLAVKICLFVLNMLTLSKMS